MHSLPLRKGGGGVLPPPGQRTCINPSEFFCRENLLFSPCVFLYSTIYLSGLMDIYFTLCAVILYYFVFLLKLTHFGHWGLFQWGPVCL